MTAHGPFLSRVFQWLRFGPLVGAVLLTLHEQALWQGMGIMLGVLWIVLIVGWVVRAVRGKFREEPLPRRMLALPVCAVFLMGCQVGNLPFRFVFWTHRPALERALQRPKMGRQIIARAPRIGLFRPLQISKSNGATRIMLWQNDDFLSGAGVGFVHCGTEAECSSAKFDLFYYDYELPPETLRLSREWRAVSIRGSNF